VAAGWFLLVSPKRSEAADLKSQKTAQDAANAKLVQKLEMLKAQQADLPEKQAELAVLRKQIPDNPALPTLVRGLTDAGRAVGVNLVTLAPEAPIPVVLPVAVTPVAPATTAATDSSDSSSTDSSSDGAATDGAATTPVVPVAPPAPSLYQVPLKLELTGSYFELEQFVNRLEGLRRSFLVTGFTLSAPDASDIASAATVELAPDDLALTIQGRVFLSPEAAAAVAVQPTPVTTATATAGQ
jgi:type IV pilus assembly protein PilO